VAALRPERDARLRPEAALGKGLPLTESTGLAHNYAPGPTQWAKTQYNRCPITHAP